MKMRKMPIGIQDFEKLRTEEYVYVDKTEYVYELTRLSTPFFLGRPRRFGKSLLLSTLRAYFEGKRELFKGLAMERLEKDWMSHPVLHIDLNVASYGSVADLEEGLDTNLRMFEEEWELDAQSAGQSPSARFHKLIRTAAERSGRKVVVLVDEYDRPLLQTMERSTPTGQRPGSFPSRSFRTRRMGPSDRLQGSQTGIGPQTNKANDDIRAALKGFYGVLKSADRWLRFVLLTGVTKFSKVSVFSDLNMLRDISMEEAYAGVCGITARELADSFGPELAALAENNGMTLDEAMAEMKKRYDGYLFAKRGERMFNPFSVLNTLAKREFDYYWFETGTPTFLIEQMKHEG
ncbi:MAG: AAA family ATPase, partial [Clostridiales Family XIII bacterium]|nr:AAA family ATPase [Clostridiales Family XIII bacterium]